MAQRDNRSYKRLGYAALAIGLIGSLWTTGQGPAGAADMITAPPAEFAAPLPFTLTQPGQISQFANELWVSQAGANGFTRVTPSGAGVTMTNNTPAIGLPVSASAVISNSVANNQLFWVDTVNNLASVALNGTVTPWGNVGPGPISSIFDPKIGTQVWVAKTAGGVIRYSLNVGGTLSPPSPPLTGITGQAQMALGKDGFVWIVETNPGAGQDRVTRWDPNVPAQVGASYLIGNALADPSSVAVSADGELWVAETGADKLLRVTADGAGNLAGSEVQLAAGAQPLTIVAGPDNAMWFTQAGLSFNNIARIANGSNVAATIGGLTNLFGPRGMALGPDNNIWVSGFGANKIAKVGTAPAPVITTTTASIITTTIAPIITTTTGPIITRTTAVFQECVKTKAVVTKIGKRRVRRYICVEWKITTSH